MRARADPFTPEITVQHRPATDHDRRQIAACRPHQQRGSRLVATDQTDNPVHLLAANGLLDRHGGKVAKHHRGGAETGFRNAENRHDDRKATGLIDAMLHPLRKVIEVGVAGVQLTEGVQDADHRAPVEQIRRQALVLHPGPMIDRVLRRPRKPFLRAKFAGPGGRCELGHQEFLEVAAGRGSLRGCAFAM